MNWLLIVGFLLISLEPLFAQAQQPDMAKLKADAQKVVSIISHDKAKSQIYCQISDLGDQIDEEKDRKKADALVQKMSDLEKQLGPEYLELLDSTKDVDPNSKDAKDIVSMFDELDEFCPD
jgi:predicted transcriptional regulator